MSGPLALVGGTPFTEGCTFDEQLISAVDASEVMILPTAAAYEFPDRMVDSARAWFEDLGVGVASLDVLARPDALDEATAERARAARFLYLVGGSPMHLRSVMHASPVWEAIVAAWRDGAVLTAASGAARVICDPMVDPRGGAFTVGLGVVDNLAVIPHHNHWSEDKAHRTLRLAPPELVIAGIDDATALIRQDDAWRSEGAGSVAVFRQTDEVDLDQLPS